MISNAEAEATAIAGPPPPSVRPWEYSRIPPLVKETIDEYVRIGQPVGSFTEAVLSNDLCAAIARADQMSMPAIPAIVGYIYNECPSGCWGSQDKVDEWIRNRGMEGVG